MKRELVNSSTIKSVGWQGDPPDFERGTLEMEFMSGGIYDYENVPKHIFEAFMRTESKGHFFQADIRPSYVCVRLHVKDCYQGSLYRETVGDKCPDTCECWCHKQRKDVSGHAKATEKAEKDAAKKAGAKAKKPRPPV